MKVWMGEGVRMDGLDFEHMRAALRLAVRGRGRTSPNPMVGAVVSDHLGVAGTGWHKGPGLPHAEREALHEAGDRARGATLYTNLEPCDHRGRTPPCTEAILEAGIARVVVAMEDPDPQVRGKGLDRLRADAVQVEVGAMASEAHTLNVAYVTHRSRGRPMVIHKSAITLDGKTSAADGTSRWITGEAARLDAHRLRAISDAVGVGVGTVIADDPMLSVRGVRSFKAPLRVIFDSSARTPPDAKVLSTDQQTLVLVTEEAQRSRVRKLESVGAEVIEMPHEGTRVSIKHALDLLAVRGVMSFLVEGGPTLVSSFVVQELVDRHVIYLAPKLLGEGSGLLRGWSAQSIGGARSLRIVSTRRFGDDLRVVAEPI